MTTYKQTSRQLLGLAIPMILSNLLNAASSIISMYFIAQLNTDALAAGAIITTTYGLFFMIALAMLFSVGIMTGQHYGAKRYAELSSIWYAGAVLALIIGIILSVLMFNLKYILIALQQPLIICNLVADYFYGLLWGFIPSLISVACSQFLMGLSMTRIIFYFSVISLILNSFLSYFLIFTLDMGIYGAGLSNAYTAFFLLFMQLMYMGFSKRLEMYRLFSKASLTMRYLKTLTQIGTPICFQYGAELLAFSVMTYLMGMIGVAALAAQQISSQLALLPRMISMGFSQAGSVMMSQAHGKEAQGDFKKIANTTLLIGCLPVCVIAFIFYFKAQDLVLFYIHPEERDYHAILSVSTAFLYVAAVTQLFDAGRHISAGILRGTGDTQSSMRTSIFSCWILGLPLACLFGFGIQVSAIGVRVGMMLGIMSGCLLITARMYQSIDKDSLAANALIT